MVSVSYIALNFLANMLFRITGKKILKKKDGIPSPFKEEERSKHLDYNLIEQLNEQSKEMQNQMS